MDNLTHSLIGAAIGQTGLKKLCGLGMATLIIAANIPDIDAACFLWLDGAEHLAFRRGITHGPPAMLILPALLTAAMVGFDRWQTRRGSRPEARLPVRPWQLFLLALIGTISHPAADWLNNYGVRLLEPFSSRWFYGDTLFIIDVWLWAILFGGWFWSRRAEKGGGNWMRRGQVVATVAGLYVFANGLITGQAEQQAAALIERHLTRTPTLVVANALPFTFWKREIVWRYDVPAPGCCVVFDSGEYDLFGGTTLQTSGIIREHQNDDITESSVVSGETYHEFEDFGPYELSDPRINAIAARNPQVRSFLFWSRMPVARFTETELILTDQRFADPRVGDRFTVRAPLSEAR